MAKAVITIEDRPDGTSDIRVTFDDGNGGGMDPDSSAHNLAAVAIGAFKGSAEIRSEEVIRHPRVCND